MRPEHQHLGVAAALFVRHLEASAKTGIMAGEMGWILETNEPMNRAMEGMGGEMVKKYRLYEPVPLSGSGDCAAIADA